MPFILLYIAILITKILVYILNPLELNKYSKKQGIPIVPDDNMGLSYINNYIKKEPFPPTYPIAIKSNFINERVMAQRGMFTVHGDDLTAIEKLCPNAVEKFVISYKAIPEIFVIITLNQNRYA